MTERSGRVVSLVSILIDLTLQVPALPPRGGDVLANQARRSVGGGFNLACAVARQGADCHYGAPHGTGPNGDLVRAALARERVAAALPPTTEGDTGFCIALIEPDMEHTYVTMPGVEARQRLDDLNRLATRSGDLIAVSGYDLIYPHSGPALEQWISAVPPGRLALDPGPLILDIPDRRLHNVLPHLSVLTMNQREARLLCGRDDIQGPALLEATRHRLCLEAHVLLVVREGHQGCVAAGADLGARPTTIPARRVTAVDTSGAGDTHTGVLLARLAQGNPTPAALDAANWAAAVSVTKQGSASAPLRDD